MVTFRSFRVAFESLMQAKVFFCTVVFTLGIALAVLVTAFSLTYQLLIAPLPYQDAENLFVLDGQQFNQGQQLNRRKNTYPGLVEAYQKRDKYFSAKALVAYSTQLERGSLDSNLFKVAAVTPEYMPVLGGKFALGRGFGVGEALDTQNPVAVISYNLWAKTYNKDPNIIAKHLKFSDTEFKIIGVLSENFIEPDIKEPGWKTDVWLPFDYNFVQNRLRKNWLVSSDAIYLLTLLNKSTSKIAANQHYSIFMANRFHEEMIQLPGNEQLHLTTELQPLSQVIIGDVSKLTLLILAGGFGLLLIVTTNIANILMARAFVQQRNLAMRAALGASRLDIFKKIFYEITLLIINSGVVAGLIAMLLIRFLKDCAANYLPRLAELHFDFVAIAFVVANIFLLSILFSFFISRQIQYRKLISAIQSGGKASGLQLSGKVRYLLIATQVVVTCALLTICLQVFTQALERFTQQTGIHMEDQYRLDISVSSVLESLSVVERKQYFTNILQHLREYPKVVQAGQTSDMPFSKRYKSLSYEAGSNHQWLAVETFCDAEYLNMLAMPLLAGRYFTTEEVASKEKVMLVNKTLANLLDVNGNVLGKYLYIQGSPDALKIIGIVNDLHLTEAAEPPRFFDPTVPADAPNILLQVKSGQQLDAREINRLLTEIHPKFRVYELESLKEDFNRVAIPLKIAAILASTLAIFTLLLAAIGIYGLLTYSLYLSRFELGIHMSLGASPRGIIAQVLRKYIPPVIVGIISATLILLVVRLVIAPNNFILPSGIVGWLFPALLILGVVLLAILLALKPIIQQPVNKILRGN